MVPQPPSLGGVLLAVTLSACATSSARVQEPICPAPEPIVAAQPTPSSEIDEATRMALFEQIVATIERHHEMAEPAFANLGRNWADDVAELRERMRAARDLPTTLRTLHELQNSLLDLHLLFEPSVPGLGRGHGPWLGLGLRLAVEPGADGDWVVYVDQSPSDASPPIAVGDVLVSIDGVPTATLLRRHRFASAANQPRPNVEVAARALVGRAGNLWPGLAGRSARLTLERRGSGERYDVTRAWAPVESSSPGLDAGLSLEHSCEGVPSRAYGPYTLTAVGVRVCVYTSETGTFARYPIVRHHGFDYDADRGSGPRLARLDHRVITDALATVRRVDGVLLDLRDNRGGDNPHVFLDWYAPGPYEAMTVAVKLHADLAANEDDRLDHSLWSSARARQYRERLQRGESIWEYPFLCSDEACEQGARHTPQRPITRAPIALIVGSGCVSSCDTLSAVFAANRFGPLVGAPTAAAYTVNRLPVPVVTRDGRSLGTMQLAFSRSRIGGDGEWIEGVPIPIDVPVPHTFANRQTHDSELVEAAIATLSAKGRMGR